MIDCIRFPWRAGCLWGHYHRLLGCHKGLADERKKSFTYQRRKDLEEEERLNNGCRSLRKDDSVVHAEDGAEFHVKESDRIGGEVQRSQVSFLSKDDALL